MTTLYKSSDAKAEIMALYDEKLVDLQIEYAEIDVKTSFGRTRIIKTGNESGKPIVLFHGINAGAPLTLEAVRGLRAEYLLYAIDTIGQATKSDENRININDNSYGQWASEVLIQLKVDRATFIGISYGAYILQKLIAHKPVMVDKAIFVVPSGLVNGSFWPSITKLTMPLLRFLLTKKDVHLKSFLSSFVSDDDTYMFRLQKALLLGFNVDYRRPTLLKAKDVSQFENPVYLMVADDDVFFPGREAVRRANKLFRNIKGIHSIRGKHMPSSSTYHEIEAKIKSWIES